MTQSVERFCSVRCHAFGSSSTVDQRKLLRNLFYPDLFPCPKNSSASVQELQQRPVPLILTSVQQLTMCFWRKSSINKPPRPNGVKINDVNSKYLTPGFRSKREVGVAYTKLNAYSFIRTLHINIHVPQRCWHVQFKDVRTLCLTLETPSKGVRCTIEDIHFLLWKSWIIKK